MHSLWLHPSPIGSETRGGAQQLGYNKPPVWFRWRTTASLSRAKGSAGPSPHPVFPIGDGNLASVMLRQTRHGTRLLQDSTDEILGVGAFFAFPGNHFLRSWVLHPCAGVTGENSDPFLLDEPHCPLPPLTHLLFIL